MMIVNMTTSISDYLCNAKKEKVGWRQILHNNFIRSKKLGGDITPHLVECITYQCCSSVAGGTSGWLAVLNTESSHHVNDGRKLHVVSASFASQKEALADVCHRTMVLLLTQHAHSVLLHPDQWSVPTQVVVMEVVRLKEAAVSVERQAGNYVGLRGDESPRVEPYSRRESEFTPTHDEAEQRFREKQIIAILRADCQSSSDGTTWPFQMPSYRWQLLDRVVEPKKLKQFVLQHPDKFTIVTHSEKTTKQWGIKVTQDNPASSQRVFPVIMDAAPKQRE